MRNTSPGTSAYDSWHTAPVRIGDRTVVVASKPGVFAHGSIDPSAGMLADAVSGYPPEAGARSLHIGSGNGYVPAVARAVGYAPVAFDRYYPNAEATRRTLDATVATIPTPADEAPLPWAAHHAVLVNPVLSPATCALATIRIPTDKLGVQLAIAEAFRALDVGGVCLLAGANDEGAKPAVRIMEQLFGNATVIAQHSASRMVAATKRSPQPMHGELLDNEWLDAERFHMLDVELAGVRFSCRTRPGVFSWQHVDEATDILASLMRIEAGERVLDLGCGAGLLGIVAARQSRTGPVLLLDADADAVRCATRNAEAAGCANITVHSSDVASAAADTTVNVVVSNPPFHLGKGTDLAIPRAFIEQAYASLLPGGRLYLVANRTLPYERLIGECFGEVKTAHDGRRFKVIGGVRHA